MRAGAGADTARRQLTDEPVVPSDGGPEPFLTGKIGPLNSEYGVMCRLAGERVELCCPLVRRGPVELAPQLVRLPRPFPLLLQVGLVRPPRPIFPPSEVMVRRVNSAMSARCPGDASS